MLTRNVPSYSSPSPPLEAFAPAVSWRLWFPENVGDQFDMFQPGSILKFVEPNVIAVRWLYFALASNSSDNKHQTCDHILMLVLSINRSLSQSRLSQMNCYGPKRTWEKNAIFNHHGSEQDCAKTCSWDNHCPPWRAAVVHDEWKTFFENARCWSSHRFGGRPRPSTAKYVHKYVRPNIPLMKYFVPFECPTCAKRQAVDIWRNGNLQTMSLRCRSTGGSNVCWLGTDNREDLDEHKGLGIHHYKGQHLENSMWTAQATGLWQHYSTYPAETSTCQEQNLLITIATLHARQVRFAC